MLKNAIYIGGGFRQHQLLYILPIVANFCKKRDIKTIIIEQKLLKQTLNHKVILNIRRNINLIYLPDLINNNKIFYKITIIKNLFKFFFKYILISRSDLLKKDSWLEKQIKHSIWDYGIKINKKKLDKLEFIPKIKSIFLACRFLTYSIILLKFFKIKFSFFQHFVYFERTLFANLRQNNTKLIQKTRHVFRVQKKNNDLSANSLDKKIYKKSFYFLKTKEINNYWKKFLSGKSNNLESKNAGNLKNQFKPSKNVIFLHVFRDSPFVCIDKNRIFADYYHWFVSTLRIIEKSDELWQIRIHPSSKKWGENSREIISYIEKEEFGGRFPNNIQFINNKLSNLQSLKNANRVVTFSGNVHLEASCLGIKPILISDCTLKDYSLNFFHKPKNFYEYQKILLKKSTDKVFRISQKQIDISRRILYLLHNACNFMSELNSSEIFFNSLKIDHLNRIYGKIYRKLFKNKIYLKELGETIFFKVDQSLNSRFIKFF